MFNDTVSRYSRILRESSLCTCLWLLCQDQCEPPIHRLSWHQDLAPATKIETKVFVRHQQHIRFKINKFHSFLSFDLSLLHNASSPFTSSVCHCLQTVRCKSRWRTLRSPESNCKGQCGLHWVWGALHGSVIFVIKYIIYQHTKNKQFISYLPPPCWVSGPVPPPPLGWAALQGCACDPGEGTASYHQDLFDGERV